MILRKTVMNPLSVYAMPLKFMRGLCCQFSNAKAQNKIIIRNQNLSFKAGIWKLQLYPFYPEIYQKKNSTKIFEISSYNPVLGLNFTRQDIEYQTAWQQRNVIAFKYDDAAKFVYVRPGSNKQIVIDTKVTTMPYSQINKQLTIKDIPEQKKIKFSYKQTKKQGNNTQYKGSKSTVKKPKKQAFQTTMQYNQYKIMIRLVQRSLFDLSGSKLVTDFQKRMQMDRINNDKDEIKSSNIDEYFRD